MQIAALSAAVLEGEMLSRSTHARHKGYAGSSAVLDRGPLLISSSNPDGWRLEDLLARLRSEVAAEALELDSRFPDSRARLDVYQKIMSALYEAEGHQRALPRSR
jgi:hypothetical protein